MSYGADPSAQTVGGTVVGAALGDVKHPNKAHFLVGLLDRTDPDWRSKAPHPIPRSCVYEKR
jgi:hypothetical protein